MAVQHIAPTVSRIGERILSITFRIDIIDLFNDIDTIVLIGKAEIPLKQRMRRSAHRVHSDVFGIKIISERGKCGRLSERTVGKQIAVKCIDDLRDLRDQLICFHLFEHCDEHTLLSVDTINITLFFRRDTVLRFSYAAIIQKSLTVNVLQSFFIITSLNMIIKLQVIVQSAAKINKILQ